MDEITNIAAPVSPNTDTDSGLSVVEQATLDSWMAELPPPAETAEVQTPTVNAEPLPDLYGGSIKATDYQFEQPADEATAMPLSDQIEIRNLMVEAGIPKGIGTQMVVEWNKAMATPKSEAELTLEGAKAYAEFERRHGERADDMLRIANDELKETRINR